jgi:hypothetical protein
MIGRDRALEAWNNSEAVNKAFIVFIAFSTFGKALFAVARSTIGQIALCIANATCRASERRVWMIRNHNDNNE